MHEFSWKHRRYPDSIAELIRVQELEIDPDILGAWQFSFEFWRGMGVLVDDVFPIGEPPTIIKAVPKWSKGQKLLPNELPPGTITWDLHTGIWWGYGNPLYLKSSFTEEEKVDYTSDVQSVMRHVWKRTQDFHSESEKWPKSITELVETGYVWIDLGLNGQWEFAYLGDPPQGIVGISKRPMYGGQGRAYEYDGISDIWRGDIFPQ